ncbi:MAG: hypothetical protein RL105_841 [Verrucomicrobiota bacterium]|jgi:putative heme-binding domain-containing protein
MLRHLSPLFLAAAACAVPAGFTIRDYVGTPQEPELYPTAVSASYDGDLYVSSDKNGSLGHIKDMGRILVAKDRNLDGVVDAMVEYARVDSPRGGHIVNGAFYLVHPPFLSVLRDKDGDGKAEERKLLVDGLGGGIEHPRGADHTTNGCRMGIDGWLYIAVGDFGAGLVRDNDGAVGTGDGKRVTLYGGGIMRVRPDGTELEVYSEMTRNNCDVAISPTLDLFTRDNTNDGKGWNTRFHHFTSLSNHGYPRLYKNFAEEAAPPLADYGGGSGTGALWISEPAFPAPFNEALLTCDWTTGTVHHHPLRRFEATFVAQQETFEKLTRAVDADVDARGRLYLADWRDGKFSYSGAGKQVGKVQILTVDGAKPAPYVDVAKAAESDLPGVLRSGSAVLRLEASRRMVDAGLTKLAPDVLAVAADAKAHLHSRVAAVFTYKQLLGAAANGPLAALAKDAAVREFVLRAIADRTTQLAGAPVQLFVDGLKDADPRVRLQALVGLQRLNAQGVSGAILEAASTWSADESKLGQGEHYRLPHTAVNALVRLGDARACLAAATKPATRALAFRALQGMHTEEAVKGLSALSLAGDDVQRAGAVAALARLYFTEERWNYKDWWSTRPDDRGPYFKPTEWAHTAKVHAALEAAYAKLPGGLRMGVLDLMAKNRIPVVSLKLEGVDPLRLVMASLALRPADVTLLTEAALQSSRPWPERVDCYRALLKAEGDEGLTARVKVLAAWSKDPQAPNAALQAVDDFINEAERGNQVDKLRSMANRADDATSTLLWKSLFTVLRSPLSKDQWRKKVQDHVNKNPRDLGFFHAVAEMGLTGFDKQLKAGMTGDNVLQINAAKAALESSQKAAARKGKRVAQLPSAEVAAAATKGRGDVKLGQKLFTQQGCIACHSVDPAAEQKGPYLGSAGAKFSREYLVDSVLEPGKVVAQGFQTVVFTMKDGAVHNGFVTGEADGRVTLRNIAGQVTLLKRDDVKDEKHLPQSMMPAGLAAGLTVEEFTSLVEYLASLRAVGG